VATDPGDGIDVTQDGLEATRHLDEHRVAGVVSVGVVDALETVDITEQHDRLGPCALRPVES